MPPRHIARRLNVGVLLIQLALLGACTAGSIRTGRVPRDPFGGSTSLVPDEPRKVPSTSGANTRRVCRSVAVPAGWIVVEYREVSETTCPSPTELDGLPKQRYRGVTLVRYADLSVGTVLEVCWDQSLPRGWHSEGDGNGRQCPREDSSQSRSPTTRRIIRDR